MKQRVSFLIGLLVLTAAAQTASASVWVNASASPNPFPAGSSLNITVNASWDAHSYQCPFPDVCWPEYIEITITGSNGYWNSTSGNLWGGTSGVYFFGDSGPGQTMSSVSYTVYVRVWYQDQELGWWFAEDGSGYADADPAPTPPTISGPNELWWFGGSSTPGYDTSIMLTSDAGSSTEWSIVAGQDKVTLSGSGGAITLTSSGTSWSGTAGDIRIVASANGATSSEFAITARTPHLLEPVSGSYGYDCDATYGYRAHVIYVIKDQLGRDLPNNVALNEEYTTGIVNDYPGANWRRAPARGLTTQDAAAFEDGIFGEAPGLPAMPQPTCDGNSQPVQHWGQAWRIGSESIGVGKLVQTNTLQKLVGRALHTNVLSPPQ